MHDFLKTAPFDIYELHLFHLVAKHSSFTRASEVAGLTQSAVTRQVQGIERRLGLDLFERTTRSVRLTPAGAALLKESGRLLGDVGRTLQTIREDFADAKKEVRVGVSRSIGLAYMPGFFHANLKRLPQVGCRVSYQASADIVSAVERNELDIGVLCPPLRMPRNLRVTHRFTDAFTLIGPATAAPELEASAMQGMLEWARRQYWLLIDEGTNTGKRLRIWMSEQGLAVEPGMQLDSFDLIINLVALGMGVSLVPIRALALYGTKQTLRRLPWPDRFVRELIVVVRRNRRIPEHLEQFIGNVLF
ncbi:MAG TPA: LysR family transcriptional regulator [Opitutaceae bacterium]|nr:LysR family transcriptional regulator [Opitutaceae bacterium]